MGWPGRPRPGAEAHLDETVLDRLVRGAPVVHQRRVLRHLAGCTTCRAQLEACDPMRSFFADVLSPPPRATVPPLPRRPAMGRRGVVALALAGAALAGLAALAAPARPTPPAPPSPLAATIDAIRTAARAHDPAALHRALLEARGLVAALPAEARSDPGVRRDLEVLREVTNTLPSDQDTASLETLVDEALQGGGGGGHSEPSPTDANSEVPSTSDHPQPLPSAPAEMPPAPTPHVDSDPSTAETETATATDTAP